MKQVLVTGSNGQLGSEIRDLVHLYPGFKFIFTDIDELDLTDHDQVDEIFQKNKIDICINCAGYTAVDKAEDERVFAMKLNHIAVEKLAKICDANKSFLVHISTDYIFDGTNHRPYNETDEPTPNSVYGLSKLKGEQAVMDFAGNAVIFRTSWLYSAYGHNFVKTILRFGEERDKLNVVSDQVGTPTYAGDLAKTIFTYLNFPLAQSGKHIFNYSNEGVTSWYDFAKAIIEISESDCKVIPIESKDFPAKANRPFYSVLNKEKIKGQLDIEIPYWLDSLRKVMHTLHKGTK